MHFAIERQHLEFFHRNKYIEFENLLTQKEVNILTQELTTNGCTYDIWRNNPVMKNIILCPGFAEIAFSLTKVRPIRIAFDQSFFSTKNPIPFFQQTLSLYDISSIQGIICGCMLHLSPSFITQPSHTRNNSSALVPLTQKEGNGIFFAPSLPLSFDYLIHIPHIVQLLIVYGSDKSVYIYQKTQPQTHALKKLGYIFGDRLKDSTHPILLKEF